VETGPTGPKGPDVGRVIFMGKYSGWIMLFAVAGTLSAVAAIAISEAFVAPTLLVLTVGEWELLAAVFYILAILLYLGDKGGKSL